jgi:hypothetical protein
MLTQISDSCTVCNVGKFESGWLEDTVRSTRKRRPIIPNYKMPGLKHSGKKRKDMPSFSFHEISRFTILAACLRHFYRMRHSLHYSFHAPHTRCTRVLTANSCSSRRTLHVFGAVSTPTRPHSEYDGCLSPECLPSRPRDAAAENGCQPMEQHRQAWPQKGTLFQ